MSAGELHHLDLPERVRRTEEQTDAAIDDIRGLAKLIREHHKTNGLRFDSIERTQAAQGRAMNAHFLRVELQLGEALKKASGAHRLATAVDKRASEIEEDLSFQAAMAVAKEDGEEMRRANAREWRKWSIQALKAVGGGTTVLAVLTFLFTRCGG